jgi:AsmA protein
MNEIFNPAPPRIRQLPAPKRRSGAGGIVVLVIIAAAIGTGAYVALTGPFSPARLKAELEHGVERATGRRFTIAGPVSVHIGFNPGITAEGISLANLPGGSRPEMITADSLTANLALIPLLAGDIVIDQAVVEKPSIILETTQDGTPNWQMHRIHRSTYQGVPEPSEPHAGAATAVEIHHIRVDGGSITYRPPQGGSFTAQIDTLSLTAGDGSSAMLGKMTGSADGVPLTGSVLAGSFNRLQGGVVNALEGAWPLTVTLQGPGASLKVDGGVNHPDDMRGYEFLITGNVQDMVPLYPWLPKAAQLPFRDVNFTTRLTDGANGDRRTSGLSLHIGGSDLGSAVPGLVLKEAVFSAPGPGQQMQLNVDGTYGGAPLRLAGTATQPDTIGGNVPLPVSLTGEAASANLTLRGTVPASWSSLGFDLQVNAHVPNLADLSPLARRPLPDIKDLVLDAHVGDAGFRLRGFNVRDLSLTSSLGDISGNVTGAWSPVPTLSGTLKSSHLDWDGVMAAYATLTADDQPAIPAPQSVAPPAPGTPPIAAASPPATQDATAPAAPLIIPDTKLPFARLHDVDGDLTISVDRLTSGGDTYRDLQAHLLAQSGKIILNPFRITAPQGVMIAGLTLDASLDPVPVTVSLRAPALSAGKIATLLGVPGGASGQMQLDANLSATGDDPRALASTATGHFGLTMVNGQFTNALFDNVLGNALTSAGVPPIEGSAAVRCLAFRTSLTQGQGRVQILALDTSRMSVTGTGRFDLGAETVDLHLKPDVRLGGTGIAAPVTVTGPFTDLRAAADAAMPGGRFGLTIGGPAPSDSQCVSELYEARGGMPGPLPAPVAAQQSSGPHKKPIDLLRGLFH